MAIISDLRYDAVLGQISLGYKNDGYAADRLAPVVRIGSRTAKYPKWGFEAFRIQQTLRARTTRANEANRDIKWERLDIEQHALIDSVADEDREDAGQIPGVQFNLEQEAVESTTDALKLEREKRVATQIRENNDMPGETLSPGQRFDAQPVGDARGGGDPLGVARAARAATRAATGQMATKMVVPWAVWEVLKEHDRIKAFLSDNTTQIVTTQLLAQIFEVDEVIVPGVVENRGTEAAPDLVDVWGKDIIFAHVPQAPGRRTLSFMYTFQLNSIDGPVRRWREEDRHADFFEVSYEEDSKIIAPAAGYVVRGVIE